MVTRLVLDCDTGTDDAVAIMLAALHPELDLLAVTTVTGNVGVEVVTENSLRVLQHVGRDDVPVHQGSATSFVRGGFPVPRDQLAGWEIHGEYLDLAPSRTAPAGSRAPAYLLEVFEQAARSGDDLVLVATGPLTNLALCVREEPAFPRWVRHLVVMGGGHEIGNVSPSAEFNFWADPEAAQVVCRAGFGRLTLVPLDATHQALVSSADCERLRALATPAALAAAAVIEQRIAAHDESQPMEELHAAPVHDAVCVALLVDPDVVTVRPCHVEVETMGLLTLGRSVIDTHQRSGRPPNAQVAFAADRRRFVDLIRATFAPAGPGTPSWRPSSPPADV